MSKFNVLAILAAGSVFAASNASAAIDTTATLASITEGSAAGVAVALAFGVAVWAIRGVKLMRRG